MISSSFLESLQSVSSQIGALANSAFASAFLSALAGAGLGVWGAQLVAERGAKSRELLEGLRQANGVTVLAATIVNQILSVKRQYVTPLSERYFKDREIALAHHKKILGGESPEPITFQAEMTKVSPITIPLDALKSLVHSAQLMPGRSLALVAMIEQSANELAHTMGIRAELIDGFRENSLAPDIFCQDYYGIERRDGNANTMYHDSMAAMTQYTDDVGFFAAELAEEMQEHAKALRDKLLKLRKDPPRTSQIDFTEARKSGLLPPKDNYKSWLSGFTRHDA